MRPENIGAWKGRRVYKIDRQSYLDEWIDAGTADLFVLTDNGDLASGNSVIGRVNLRTMDVEEYDPRDFVSVRTGKTACEIVSSYKEPTEPEYQSPTSLLGDAEIDAILDNAMHGSVVGGINLDDIGTIGDLDVGDNFRPKG